MNFARLAQCFDQLEETSSRNRMVEIIADLFREVEQPDEAAKIVYLGQGRLVPPFEPLEFGVGEAMVRDALVAATGAEEKDVRARFRELGDFGSVAQALLAGRAEANDSVEEVYDALYAVATASGKGSV